MRLLAAALLCAGCLEAPPSGSGGDGGGGGGGGACGTAGALQDQFDGDALDLSLWGITGDVSASGGDARINAAVGDFNQLYSAASYQVSGSRLVAELDVSGQADAFLSMDLHSADNSQLGITLHNGALGLWVFDQNGQRTIDAALLEQDHVWFLLREEAGQFYWATSSDGANFAERGPFEESIGELARVEFDLLADNESSTVIVQAVNAGSSVPYCAAASFSDDFASQSPRWQEDAQGTCLIERDGQATLGYADQALCALTTLEQFDLRDSSFAVELAEAGDCRPEPIMVVFLASGQELSIKCRDDGGVAALVAGDKDEGDISVMNYQSELHRFVRLRHDSADGNLHFETHDGGPGSWIPFGSTQVAAGNVARTALRFYLGGPTDGGFESVTFDSFNLAPP